jgi:GNAT superfamily N-acetyltransferase
VIRDAGLGDLDAIVTMAEQFITDSVYRQHIPTRPTALKAFAERLIAMEDATILLALEGEQPIGMLALWAYQHPFVGETVAAELVWWVHPERRGVGVRLLKQAERWARAHGAFALQMVAPSDRVARFYQACGFTLVETMYQKEIAR